MSDEIIRIPRDGSLGPCYVAKCVLRRPHALPHRDYDGFEIPKGKCGEGYCASCHPECAFPMCNCDILFPLR